MHLTTRRRSIFMIVVDRTENIAVDPVFAHGRKNFFCLSPKMFSLYAWYKSFELKTSSYHVFEY
jgi:hypothetical protein